MAIRYSDAAVYKIAGDVGLRRVFEGSYITFFSGSQPTSANSSVGSSQPIISFTLDGGAYVAETQAEWQFTLSSILGSVTVSSVNISGFELLEASVTETTITELCESITTSINSSAKNLGYTAVNNNPAITIKAPKGTEVGLNVFSIAVVDGGNITVTYDDTSHTGAVTTSGVANDNGLSFDTPADGSLLSPVESVMYLSKPSGSVWSGLNGFNQSGSVFAGISTGTTYTAGWGRICVDDGDTGLTATSGADGFARCDFSVGTSAADCIMLPSPAFLINTVGGSEIQSLINSFKLKINKNMA